MQRVFVGVLATVVCSFLLGGPTFAVPVNYVINGLTFDDTGTGSGSFTYDATTNTYSNIDITTTAGNNAPGSTYLYVAPTALAQTDFYVITVNSNAADVNGAYFFTLQFGAHLTSSTITDSIIGYNEGVCTDSMCTNGNPLRSAISGSVSASSPETPIPSALPLFATGLGGLGLFGWCRKKKAAAQAA